MFFKALGAVASWLTPATPWEGTNSLVNDSQTQKQLTRSITQTRELCLHDMEFMDFSWEELIALAKEHPEVIDTRLYLETIRSRHPTLKNLATLDKALVLPGDLEARYDHLAEMLVSFASGVEDLLQVMENLSGKPEVKEIAFRKAFGLLEEDVTAVKKWTEDEREKYLFLLDCLTSHIEKESLALEFELKIHYLGVKIEGDEPSPEPCT